MRSSRRLVIPGWNSFRQTFANVLFKLILQKKGTDQVQNSDLILKEFTSESSATRHALCALSRENTANVQNEIQNSNQNQ